MMKKLLSLLFVFVSTMATMLSAQTMINCDAGSQNFTYCYNNNDNTQLVYQSSNGAPLILTFNSGTTEGSFDEVLVLDTDGTNLNADNPYGDNGELSGFSWTSTGDTITLQIQSDFSVSCSSGSEQEWNFDVRCQTCIPPTVEFNVVDGDCDNFEFFVDVVLSDLGSADAVAFADDQGSSFQVLSAPGTVTFGPYSSTIEAILTANTADANCLVTSDPQSFSCPPPPSECALIFAGDDVEVNCPSPEITLSATVQASGIDRDNYEINGFDACPLPATSGGTPTDLTIDDRWSEVIDLTFDFCFFGETYDQILVGANGLVTFDLEDAGQFCPWNIDPGDAIPSPDIPVNSIMGAWHDIDPSVNGNPDQIQYFILGSAPSRQFVINYNSVPQFGSSCNNFETTQQIILYELSNVIDVNLINKPLCTAWNDGNAIVGIQNANGTNGFAPANRNGGPWEAINETYRFSYAGDDAYEFEWRDENGDVVGTDLDLNITPTETQIFTAAVTYINCDGSENTFTDDVLVTLNADFEVDVTSDSEDCFVGSTTLTANVTNNTSPTQPTYLWNTNETTESITVTDPGTYTVAVTIDDCTLTESITVASAPIFDLGPDFESCLATPQIIDATPSNYILDEVSFQWSINGIEISNETDPTITATQTGTYSVVVTALGVCSETDSVTITEGEAPIVDLGADFASCLITPAILDATPSNYDAADTTFQWSLDGTVIPGETDATLSASVNGTYTVLVAFGVCETTDEITINEGDEPMVDLGADFNDCLIEPATLDATPSNYDVADASFEWSLNGNVIPMETDPTLSVSENGTYSVLVTVGNCTTTDDITISEGDAPLVDLGEDFADCLIEPATLDATPSNYDVADATFEWSYNGTVNTAETGPSIMASENGTYSVTVTVGNCETVDTITITEGDAPIVDLGEDFESCFITPSTLDATPSNYDVADATFVWTMDGNEIAGETDATLTVTSIGTYDVTVTVGNCVTVDEIIITEGDEPMVDLGDDFATCFIMPATLDATPSNYDVANATFEWSLDGTVITGETDATLEVDELGTYSVLVTVGSCTTTDSITITEGDEPMVDLGTDFTSCFLTPETLDATPSNYAVADATFEWSLDGTVIAGETDAILEIGDLGTYTVVVTVGLCSSSDSVTVTAGESPMFDLGSDFSSCLVTAEVLDATPSNYNVADASFEWTLNGAILSGETNATLQATELGVYSVTVTVGSCSATDNIAIDVRTDLSVSIEGNVDTVFGCGGDTTLLTAVASEDGVTYQWFDENGNAIAGATNSTYESGFPDSAGSPNTISVEVSKGFCVASDDIDLERYEVDNCTISQGLSPDSTPGFNDCLDLQFLADRTGITSIELFNVHGRSVFKSNNYVSEWCGQSSDGDKLPTGTYFYVIKLNGTDVVFGQGTTGYIYLNRLAN